MKFADPRESAKIRGRTESERVIGFNAITLRAAFHKYYNGKKYSFKIENSQVGKGGLPPPTSNGIQRAGVNHPSV